ncbi:MAG: hypothetical protein ABII22_01330 [Candidatus Micrarchaeota archaeon]
MKCALAMLLAITLIFSTYEIPPLNEVELNNLNVLVGASAKYTAMQNNSEGPVYFANATMLAIDPSIDSRISYSQVPDVLWTFASGYDEEYHDETPSKDGYYCFGKVDKTNLELADYNVQTIAKFVFKNITKTIENPEFYFTIPFNTNELAASEKDTIQISINVQFAFIYDRKREVWEPQSFGEGVVGCGLQPTPDDQISMTRDVAINSTYQVEGESTEHFLVAPVLREQWFRNNRFDSIFFTNREIYSSQVKLNNETIKEWKFHLFDIESDSLGMQRIISLETMNQTNGAKENHENVTIPKGLLRGSKTFGYAYEINSTYPGIGDNLLEVEIMDEFGNILTHSEIIRSRMLSYNGNTSETGAVNGQNMRKGIGYEEEKTKITYIEFGMIGILLIVLFLNIAKRNND